MAGAILWLTGLPSAGKSTLASEIGELIRGQMPVEILDGDEIRRNLSSELGFSKRDRDVNIRRIGFVARLLARNGVFTIVAAISPYRETRDEMRRLAEQEHLRFLEVFVDANLQTLIGRDTKGLYRRALAGEIERFTGISDPYEAPSAPDLVVTTDKEAVAESVDKILNLLASRDMIAKMTITPQR